MGLGGPAEGPEGLSEESDSLSEGSDSLPKERKDLVVCCYSRSHSSMVVFVTALSIG